MSPTEMALPPLRRSDCLICPARSRTICAAVPEEQIDRIALIKRPARQLKPHDVIYVEDAQCVEYFTVLHGWVALTALLERGQRVVLDFALPGDFFGFQADPAAPRTQSAVAITSVRLCPLPKAEVEALINVDPVVAAHLAHLIAAHEARAHDHVINSNTREARQRVAHLLIELYFRQRQQLPRQPHDTIELPLTLALIADTIGLTPVHVSRTLRRLREQGVVRFHRRRLYIEDPDALMRVSGIDDWPLTTGALKRE